MDPADRAKIVEALGRTLDDERLSRSEARAFKEVAGDLAGDAAARAFLRNRAFEIASERVNESPKAVVRWLQRIDGILDRARPAAAAEPVDRVAFSPGDDCRQLVRETLQGARKTIDVCMFTITDDRITRTLVETRRRGIRVRVITDDDKQEDAGSDVDRLRRADVSVRTDQTEDHMHHKFAVVDGTWLVNGSFNWTRSAGRNHENVHVTNSGRVVRPYQTEFERLWATLAD